MWLFATFKDIERIPYQIEVEDEKMLNVVVEGRKPNCYICGERGHMKAKCPLYEFTQPQQEKAQTEEEIIVDHTEEIKERQKCETEKTKEKNENGATNPKKRRKISQRNGQQKTKKEIKKPETNNVQEEEERTDKDVKYKGLLIKYENCEQMERKVERLEEIIRVKTPEKCAEKCILTREERCFECIKELDEKLITKRIWLVETPPPRTDYLQLLRTDVTMINGRKFSSG
ncbi:uncharacterized protein LOC128247323 isoform X2 [Octopus bimaculoides]|uniref:uncharacterized protein LOC128247323 isoform X2 n=1 Tax=Octopus bimaculoides TaxID=37653 RepID=UPI0022E56F82|nr:uncharacterized protein LOC128247323 isoform X2 [Octopus bimaculoides]